MGCGGAGSRIVPKGKSVTVGGTYTPGITARISSTRSASVGVRLGVGVSVAVGVVVDVGVRVDVGVWVGVGVRVGVCEAVSEGSTIRVGSGCAALPCSRAIKSAASHNSKISPASASSSDRFCIPLLSARPVPPCLSSQTAHARGL